MIDKMILARFHSLHGITQNFGEYISKNLTKDQLLDVCVVHVILSFSLTDLVCDISKSLRDVRPVL
ncbi:hypothetical protein D3C86_1114790 [compost metagenome]